MKHTINGFLVYQTASFWGKDERIVFQSCEPWKGQQTILIKPHALVVEIPDDFDPRAGQIDALKAQQRQAAAEFQKLCTDIKRQISELEAIEYAGPKE